MCGDAFRSNAMKERKKEEEKKGRGELKMKK
jgi:hypothetical protein